VYKVLLNVQMSCQIVHTGNYKTTELHIFYSCWFNL